VRLPATTCHRFFFLGLSSLGEKNLGREFPSFLGRGSSKRIEKEINFEDLGVEASSL